MLILIPFRKQYGDLDLYFPRGMKRICNNLSNSVPVVALFLFTLKIIHISITLHSTTNGSIDSSNEIPA